MQHARAAFEMSVPPAAAQTGAAVATAGYKEGKQTFNLTLTAARSASHMTSMCVQTASSPKIKHCCFLDCTLMLVQCFSTSMCFVSRHSLKIVWEIPAGTKSMFKISFIPEAGLTAW